MRAIGLESFEEQPKVLDQPVPEPGPGEVLVKVSHSSVNGMDVAVASGMVKDFMEHRFPVVLGKDFAGIVEAVGEGVMSVSEGDRVFGVLVRDYVGDGTFAEYAVVPEAIGLATVPAELDLAVAGVLGLASTTAYQSVSAVAPENGDTVLIAGATGGVGSTSIQLAASRGATVIATARLGKEADLVKELGAHHTIDYADDIGRQVRTIAPGGVDAVIHLAGDPTPLAELVRAGGRFASTLGVGPDQLSNKDLKATAIVNMPERDTLDELAARAASGRLRVPIERTYGLEDVTQALKDFTRGTLGKFGVTVS
jgi:NADPH:quinone reductase